MHLKFLRFIIPGLLLAWGLFLGLKLSFSEFMIYDDEGYVLLTLRSVAEGHALYESVYSQYGPFYYAFYTIGLQLFNLEIDHTTGRLINLFFWLFSALVTAWVAGRVKQSNLVFVVSFGIQFPLFRRLQAEPTHPGALIVFLLSVIFYCFYHIIYRERGKRIAYWSLGSCIAALLLIKINVGILALLAVLLLLSSERKLFGKQDWLYWMLFVGSALAVLAVPIVLMSGAVYPESVFVFKVLYYVGAILLIAVLYQNRAESETLKPWMLLLGFFSFGSLVLVWTVIQGTSLLTVLDAVLIRPLNQTNAFSSPVPWHSLTIPFAILLSVITGLRIFISDKQASYWIQANFIAHVIGVLLLLFIITNTMELHLNLFFSFLMPAAVYLCCCGTDEPEKRFFRYAGCFMFFQCLHAYPVAGSQMFFAAVFLVPLLVAYFYQQGDLITSVLRKINVSTVWLQQGVLLVVLLILVCLQNGKLYSQYKTYTQDRVRLGLKGAEAVFVVEKLAAINQVFVANLQTYATSQFSMPGMHSYEIWSGVQAPTRFHSTAWWGLLNEGEQAAILQELKADPNAMLILSRPQISNFDGFPMDGALVDYVLSDAFEVVIQTRTFDLLCKQGRAIEPLWTGNVTTETIKGAPVFQYRFNLPAINKKQLVAIEIGIQQYGSPSSRPRIKLVEPVDLDEAQAFSFQLPVIDLFEEAQNLVFNFLGDEGRLLGRGIISNQPIHFYSRTTQGQFVTASGNTATLSGGQKVKGF